MLLAAFLVPFFSALLHVPLVGRVARKKNWVDNPDGGRKMHEHPTPNIGGIAIAISFGVGFLALLLVNDDLTVVPNRSSILVFVGALVVIFAGFYDDLFQLGFKKKFLVQSTVAYLLLHAGYHIELEPFLFLGTDPYQQALYSIPLTIIWIVGILNAVNLLDGLDGLAAGVCLIAFSCLAVLFVLQGNLAMAAIALLMVGGLLAFLVFNYTPASIFMGDSGSLFLGYMLVFCTLSLRDTVHVNPLVTLLVPVILLGLPILDTCLCILRRLLAKKSPFYPDHDHIHHRLSRLLPRHRAVIILYGVALWFGLAAILMTRVNSFVGFVIVSLTLFMAYMGIRLLDEIHRTYRITGARSSDSAVDEIATMSEENNRYEDQSYSTAELNQDFVIEQRD